jgi:hypothetical protein
MVVIMYVPPTMTATLIAAKTNRIGKPGGAQLFTPYEFMQLAEGMAVNDRIRETSPASIMNMATKLFASLLTIPFWETRTSI